MCKKSLGIHIPSRAFWAVEGGEESGDGRSGCGGGCWCQGQRVGSIILAQFSVEMKDGGGKMGGESRNSGLDGIKP
nr:hypothetical protein CFP56_45397 [Quercus suber]